MTVGIATSAANSLLDTHLSVNWIQLHTGDPGSGGTANTVASGTVAQSRQQATMASAASASKSLTGTPQWVAWDGPSVTITHITIWTLVSAGVFKQSVALTTGKAVTSGDTLTLNTLTASITPVAA
jgi:hypothetical protein